MKSNRGQGVRWALNSRAADAGWTLSGSVLGCLFLGYLIGDYWGVNPTMVVVGLFLGVVIGFYNLAKVMWGKRD